MSGPSPRHSRLVIVVRGLDGPERRSLRRLGHDVIDVMRPRDPGVRVREAGSHSKARGLARTAERRTPLCCILGASGNPAFTNIARISRRTVPDAWARPPVSWHAVFPGLILRTLVSH